MRSEINNFLISTMNEDYIDDSFIELKNNDFLKIPQNNIINIVDDNKYNIVEHDEIFNIFDDIKYISIDNNNNTIELAIDLPKNFNIIAINNIKISKKLDTHIKNIYLKINNISYETFNSLKKIYLENNNANFAKTIHIIFNNLCLNNIFNKNIYVNYSCMSIKNKIKFKF